MHPEYELNDKEVLVVLKQVLVVLKQTHHSPFLVSSAVEWMFSYLMIFFLLIG